MTKDLHAEAEKVRSWLASNAGIDQYEFWWSEDGVVDVVQDFLARVQPESWSEQDVTDLLYLLEQSTTGYVVELFAQREPTMLAIARHSLARGGIADDDIADQLRYCVQYRDEAEALLFEFMKSEHERTRRLALLSLAELGSKAVPALAVAAWDTGHEYLRLGALAALQIIGSELLPTYLAKAQEDGREHLLALARKFLG